MKVDEIPDAARLAIAKEQYGKHACWRVNGVWYPADRTPLVEMLTQDQMQAWRWRGDPDAPRTSQRIGNNFQGARHRKVEK